MLKTLANVLFGSPSISPEERDEVLAYLDESSAVLGLQTCEAERYNSAMLEHVNQHHEPESAQAMVQASRRLALCAKECILRHGRLSVPDVAMASHLTQGLVFHAYSEWANAQHDAFVAMSHGRSPFAERVQHLMSESERRRVEAEREEKKLLRPLGLTADDLQRIMVDASQSLEAAKWEPEPDTE